MQNRSLTCWVCTTLVILICAADARATTPAATQLIEEATADFGGLDFEGALGKLERALATPGNSRADLARIYSLEGLCLISLNRKQDAQRAFAAALSLDPELRLDKEASPLYQAPFQQVADRRLPALHAEVEVPERLEPGQPVPIVARLAADPAGLVARLVIHHRRAGAPKYSAVKVKLSANKRLSFYLPPGLWLKPGNEPIEWYAVVQDRFGGELEAIGERERPLRIQVVAKPGPVAAAPVVSPAPLPPSAWYEKWWVWAIVGGVAVAAGGTAMALTLPAGNPSRRDFAVEIR